MKKIALILLAICIVPSAFAQLNNSNGVTHYAKDANVGAADSLHYIGILNLYSWGGNQQSLDSASIVGYGEDTLNVGLVVRAFNPLIHTPGTVTADTASVSYLQPITQYTEALPWIVCWPWHKIATALGLATGQRCEKIECWLRVKSSSAVASGGAKITVKARPYY